MAKIAFREYNANRFGGCVCFTCGSINHWKDCDAGHYIDRRWESLKYSLLNLEVQCRRCNRLLDGNIPAFERQLSTKYGGGWIVSFLDNAKHKFKPLDSEEVEWLISYLRIGIKSKLLF